mgnify:CR=1 FL=1
MALKSLSQALKEQSQREDELHVLYQDQETMKRALILLWKIHKKRLEELQTKEESSKTDYLERKINSLEEEIKELRKQQKEIQNQCLQEINKLKAQIKD